MKNIEQLNTLRKKIDSIDNSIIKMLIQRSQIAKKIGDKKKEGSSSKIHIFRPERQAVILRKLISMSLKKGLSPLLVSNIWKEIFGSQILLQGGVRISSYLGEKDNNLISNIYSLIGLESKIFMKKDSQLVINSLLKDQTDIGALVFPNNKDNGSWWTKNTYEGLYIISCAPMISMKKQFKPKIVILSKNKPKKSGNDISLFVSKTKQNTSNEFKLLCNRDNLYLYAISKYLISYKKEFKYLGSYPNPILF